MSLFAYLLLGAVQGITEWLPISSEGINTLIMVNLFHQPVAEAVNISIWLHSGTLLAALIYFRKEITQLLRNLPQYARELRGSAHSEASWLTTFLIISTLLTGIVGAPLFVFGLGDKEIPAGLVTAIIGIFLIITGLVQRYARKLSGTKAISDVKDAILLGVVQAFSVFPGLSRSGLTVSALLFRGYNSAQVIRLSFLMSIPAVLAAEIGLALIDEVDFALPAIGSVVISFVLGFLTIGALIRIAPRIAFWKFCIFIGVLSLLALVIEQIT